MFLILIVETRLLLPFSTKNQSIESNYSTFLLYAYFHATIQTGLIKIISVQTDITYEHLSCDFRLFQQNMTSLWLVVARPVQW